LVRVVDDLDSSTLVCIDKCTDAECCIYGCGIDTLATRTHEAGEVGEGPEAWRDEVGVTDHFDQGIV
jgi:hypothetical protein